MKNAVITCAAVIFVLSFTMYAYEFFSVLKEKFYVDNIARECAAAACIYYSNDAVIHDRILEILDNSKLTNPEYTFEIDETQNVIESKVRIECEDISGRGTYIINYEFEEK